MRDKIKLTGNLAIELKTIIAMTDIYCRDHHSTKECQSCEDFIEHAKLKLDRCVYGDKKPACKKCPIHCYKPDKREQARIIMRYSGPKMLFKHPLLAIKHLIKATKKFPATIPEGISNYHLRKNKQ
ncbi:nitrous oxide-stimulated promoter family protein [Psychromonas algicola]|uniref:nitrous oxide-stimulated promoter family protein n=1 Tax=Psychromonas algicola TaxID=2555642 RepID=UPI0010680933|nr:nitrous oxide-stimulated promoter family protein [Psychromonas sp. RZ5]TEW52876.1 nitrous oxide-stimulated promoter family protein [Psychromonas sp. RZ5]